MPGVPGFEDVNYYFRTPAPVMDLSANVERMLVTPFREVKVDVSITLDNGELGLVEHARTARTVAGFAGGEPITNAELRPGASPSGCSTARTSPCTLMATIAEVLARRRYRMDEKALELVERRDRAAPVEELAAFREKLFSEWSF